nr:MAG TPA: hypothetical protein [Caudoviricetes sp.]
MPRLHPQSKKDVVNDGIQIIFNFLFFPAGAI